ncbi:proteolipid protein 2-like [Centruroides vittatus]|uniref:proteolipid protein 2-like n=1 Tax=Centruroides vittatus TaxID=120091 RepID=UPI00350EA85C
MASQDFPNTLSTAATVAAATYATSAATHAPPPPPQPSSKPTVNIHFDRSYAQTKPGILKIAQVVNNVVGLLCIIASQCHYCSASNWFNFVASTSFFVTLILLVLYFYHIIEKLRFIPWLKAEFGYCAVWTLFYAIAAIIMSVKGSQDDAWAAAAFFGFVGTGLYGADAFLKFKALQRGDSAQGSSIIPSATSPTSPMSPSYAAY